MMAMLPTPLLRSLPLEKAMSLQDKLRKPVVSQKRGPVWDGPESPEANGGVTFSLLSRFLACRERFRCMVVDGLRPAARFEPRIEYGQMWHVCEEALAAGKNPQNAVDQWQPLKDYCRQLCKTYPTQMEEVDRWYNVCRVQFPVYVDYWRRHPDVADRTPLMQEQVFRVPYTLPSGRTVYLRGKLDSVDLVGRRNAKEVWLQENKTKGDVRPEVLTRNLTYDLQTMLYLVALLEKQKDGSLSEVVSAFGHTQPLPIVGVRYNVVRRPLSGGKGTIVKKKGSKNVPAETDAEYYARLRKYIEDEPDTYFFRWNVEVTEADVAAFRQGCLDPVLEQLCCWWDWVAHRKEARLPGWAVSFRFPFGVYNPTLEGNASDLDEYLRSGSTVGLRRETNLFPEL